MQLQLQFIIRCILQGDLRRGWSSRPTTGYIYGNTVHRRYTCGGVQYPLGWI